MTGSKELLWNLYFMTGHNGGKETGSKEQDESHTKLVSKSSQGELHLNRMMKSI